MVRENDTNSAMKTLSRMVVVPRTRNAITVENQRKRGGRVEAITGDREKATSQKLSKHHTNVWFGAMFDAVNNHSKQPKRMFWGCV